MAKLDPEAVQSSKRLLEVVAAGALMCSQELKALYLALGLGRGVLTWRRMPQETEAATGIEVWAYLAALMVSMVGHHRPGVSDQLMLILEGALLDAQRINYRPEYEGYRHRLRDGRPPMAVPDPKVFGPMYGLHQEFCARVARAWRLSAPSRPFIGRISELTGQVERGYQKTLEELWPRG